MYSSEIDELMKLYKYNIDNETYINIINNSPQLNHIIYKQFGNYYEMWDCNGKYWKYNVYKL